MVSLLNLPKCAFECVDLSDLPTSCDIITDVNCFCEASTTIDQACFFQACPLKDVLGIANSTFTLCGVEPKKNTSFIPIFITFLAAAAVFVVLRWVARFIMGMKLWWDDFLNFAAYLCCIAYTVYGVMLQRTGFGTETWAVPFENLKEQLIGYYLMSIIFFTARFLVRLSILFFYMRIFRATRADKIIQITLWATVLIFIPLYIIAIFPCRPMQFLWNKIDEGAHGTCVEPGAYLRSALILLLLNDFWILILPIPLIARLQLSWRKRFLVLAMFGMGVGVIITSIYKITLVDEYSDASSPTTNVVRMSIWAGVEINLGVIFACLPSMPALLQPVMSHFGGGSRASQGPVNYRNSGHVSRYDMLDKPNISLPASVASREVDKQIRMTTTIQQNIGISESQTRLPLHDDDKDAIELGDTLKGVTRAKAWA